MDNFEILKMLKEKAKNYAKIDLWIECNNLTVSYVDFPADKISFDKVFNTILLVDKDLKVMIELKDQNCEIDKDTEDTLMFHTKDYLGNIEKVYVFDLR